MTHRRRKRTSGIELAQRIIKIIATMPPDVVKALLVVEEWKARRDARALV